MGFYYFSNSNSRFEKTTGVDTSDFARKADLAILKSNIDELDTDKLEKVPNDLSSFNSKVDELKIGTLKTTPVNLSEGSEVVKSNVVKKTEYDKLVKKANAIVTSGLVKKIDYSINITY